MACVWALIFLWIWPLPQQKCSFHEASSSLRSRNAWSGPSQPWMLMQSPPTCMSGRQHKICSPRVSRLCLGTNALHGREVAQVLARTRCCLMHCDALRTGGLGC